MVAGRFHAGFALRGRFQPGMRDLPRSRQRELSAGASMVIVLPAPIVAPSPIFAPAPPVHSSSRRNVVLDHGAEFVGAVVVGGDGARADIHVGADRRVTDIRQMVGLAAAASRCP